MTYGHVIQHNTQPYHTDTCPQYGVYYVCLCVCEFSADVVHFIPIMVPMGTMVRVPLHVPGYPSHMRTETRAPYNA
jgi:hypothetical protein